MIKFIKILFKIKRYFIITYMYSYSDGSTGWGNARTITNGFYPNRDDIFQAEKEKNAINGVELKSILVTNIIEMSKSDYADYNYNKE